MNSNSTEDYLDSLLRAIQQKEESVPEPEILEPVQEPQILEQENVEEEVISELEAEVLIPEDSMFSEELTLPEISDLFETPEELEISELPEIFETSAEATQKEEYFIPADEPTVLDILSGDPNKPLSAEEIQAMFAQAEENENVVQPDAMQEDMFLEETLPITEELPIEEELLIEETLSIEEELPIEEALSIEEELPIEEDLSVEEAFADDLPPIEEVLGIFSDELPVSEEAVSLSAFDEQILEELKEDLNLDELFGEQTVDEADAPTMTGQEMFADEIQNLSEDDIMSLLQQSADIAESDFADSGFGEVGETEDLDALLTNMSDDADVAKLQDLFEKSENNEPVSTEVEEMIELNGSEEGPFEVNVETDSKPGLFGKLKSKLFSKKKKKDKLESLEEIDAEPIIDIAEKEETVDEANLSELLNFSDVTESVNLVEGATGLEDFMAETGGLDFGGMQNNATETFSFDQLFDDTSNVQTDNSEMSDISDLLKSLESAEGQSDIFDAGDDLFASMNSEDGIETIEGLLEGSEEEPKKEKKSGLFARLINFLTAEDEDEDSDGMNADGVEKLGVTSEENKEALAQLDKEGNDDKKKKKKKGKKGETADEDLDEDEDQEPQDDKKKKKKAKKEKKQKEPKVVEDVNEPVLSKKKVRSTFLFAFTVLAAILIGCLFIPDLFEKKSARNAFYDGDYATCYQTLYGKKLSESDRLMFEQSEYMLALQRRVDAYDNFIAVDDELRALESLIQEVAKQEEVLKTAESYGFTAEAEQSYQEILNILAERYQVSEADALTINGYKQDALYTLHLKAIVAGEEFVCPDYLREDGQAVTSEGSESTEASQEDVMEDVLPAEEELTETEFEEGTN